MGCIEDILTVHRIQVLSNLRGREMEGEQREGGREGGRRGREREEGKRREGGREGGGEREMSIICSLYNVMQAVTTHRKW